MEGGETPSWCLVGRGEGQTGEQKEQLGGQGVEEDTAAGASGAQKGPKRERGHLWPETGNAVTGEEEWSLHLLLPFGRCRDGVQAATGPGREDLETSLPPGDLPLRGGEQVPLKGRPSEQVAHLPPTQVLGTG